MADTDSTVNETDNEIKIFYENAEQNTPSTPLIIKKLSNIHSQSIKVSITNKGDPRHNNLYENNNNINNNKQENEIEAQNIQNTNYEASKNADIVENNNNQPHNTNNNAFNNNATRLKHYYTPLFSNQQYNLRYKDPKTGKLFSKILFDDKSFSPLKVATEDDGLNNIAIPETSRKMLSVRSNKNKPISPTPATISLFRSHSNLTKSKQMTTTERSLSFRNDDSISNSNAYNWKAKNERAPVKLAPDRLYLNTYMDHYVNKNKNENRLKETKSPKINNIKFQGVSPFYGDRTKPNDSIISANQIFEKIFDMNSKFLNMYFPNSKKQNSARTSLSRTHALPGHVALESATNNNHYFNYNTPSKRPLKFENPALYKTPKSALSTSRSTASSINNDNSTVYDLETIEIPIILKSPNSVNSYLNYLKKKSNIGLFRSTKV